MLDRLREDLPRLVQAATGVEHMVDLGPVLGPLVDLVEIAVVRDQRVAGFPFRLRLLWIVLWRQATMSKLYSSVR